MKIRENLTALAVGIFLLYGSPTGEAAALSIQEAVDLALAQNTSLRITEKGEETAKAALKSARGANSFDLGLNGSLTDGRTNNEDRQDNGSLTLRAGLPLYTGGRNQANIESAEIGVDAA
ncbi:MAG: TolC family protein, partial [Schwartzia sp.]|nr:TolC family protein [Schwartzia sp. (in: firmicutes)]